MKRITPYFQKTVSLLLFGFLLFGIVLYLDSCKKNETVRQSIDDKAGPPDWVVKKIKEEGNSISIKKEEHTAAVFLDQNEKERPAFFWRTLQQNGNRTVCDATDDQFLDNGFTYNGFTVNFYGYSQAGFSVKTQYILTTGFEPLSANPFNPSQLSRGRLRVKDRVSGNVLYSFRSIAMSIQFIGATPGRPGLNDYKLEFTSPVINDPNIRLLDLYFDARPVVYTDCPDAVITPGDWQGDAWGVVAADPCKRVDNIYILPAGSGKIFISGCNALSPSIYPAGVTIPNEHWVEYKPVSGDVSYKPVSGIGYTWLDRSTPRPYCYIGEYLSSTDTKLATLPHSGTYLIRYRNIVHDKPDCFPGYLYKCQGPFEVKTIVVP